MLLQSPISVGITAPNVGIIPTTPIGTILSNALIIIFIFAALLVLFYLIWGAFDWITSGGDKEKVGSARKKIYAALIGFAILALAFLIVTVVGQILKINIFSLKFIPTLDAKCDAGFVFDPTATPVNGQVPCVKAQ